MLTRRRSCSDRAAVVRRRLARRDDQRFVAGELEAIADALAGAAGMGRERDRAGKAVTADEPGRGSQIESDDEATVPSWVVPLGAAGGGAALALTSVSCPLEPTRDRSAVFVCAVVVVCASVVSTGWLAPFARRRACSFGKMNS